MSAVILNFHGLGAPRRSLEEGESEYWLNPDMYRRVLDIATASSTNQRPQVLFTFDDGNLSDMDIGAVELTARGLTATFFVLAGRLNTAGSLATAHLRALVAKGHRIGLHGHSHIDWRRMGPEEAAQELDDARAQIQDALGVEIDEAAVPFGSYDRRVLHQLAERGYRSVYTSDGGVSGGGWLRPRTSIRRDMIEADITRIISGAESPARRLRRRLAMTKKRYL